MSKRVCFWVMVLFAFQIPFCGICQEAFQSKQAATMIQSSAVNFFPVKNKLTVEPVNKEAEIQKPTPVVQEEALSSFVTDVELVDPALFMPADWKTSPELLKEFDMNGDGVLNMDDLQELFSHIGESTYFFKYDLNGNGRLDFNDVVLLYKVINFDELSSEDQQALLDALSTDAAAAIISALVSQGDTDLAAGFLANMDPEKAAEILSSMDAKAAAQIIASDNISVDTAVEIFKIMDADTAAAILSEGVEACFMGGNDSPKFYGTVSSEKAAAILDGLDLLTAFEILSSDNMDAEAAASILNEMDTFSVSNFFVVYMNSQNFDAGKAAAILGAMDSDKAASVIDDLTKTNGLNSEKVNNIINSIGVKDLAEIIASDNISAEDAAEILANMDPDKAAEILAAERIVGIQFDGNRLILKTESIISPEKAAAILGGLDLLTAFEILSSDNIDAEAAASILNEMDTFSVSNFFVVYMNSQNFDAGKAAAILGAMDSDKAASVIDDLTKTNGLNSEQVNNIINSIGAKDLAEIIASDNISAEDAAEILANMDPDKAAEILAVEQFTGAVIGYPAKFMTTSIISPEKAAEILSSMDAKAAAQIIASDNISVDKAIAIFQNMDSKAAAAILGAEDGYVYHTIGGVSFPPFNLIGISCKKAGQILAGLSCDKAADILDQGSVSVFRAAKILNTVDKNQAFRILSSMNPDKAVKVFRAMMFISRPAPIYFDPMPVPGPGDPILLPGPNPVSPEPANPPVYD